MEPVFAHTIGRADFIGGAVRLELVTFQPDPTIGSTATTAQVSQVVFLPLDGFLKSVSVLDNLVQQFARAGLIQPAQPPAPPTTAPAAPAAPPEPAPARPPASPNFG